MDEPEAADLLSFTVVTRAPDWSIVSWSPTGRSVLGLAGDALTGRSLLDLTDSADDQRLRAALEDTAGAQRSKQLHVRLLDPSGQALWFEVQLHPRDTERGEVLVLLRPAAGRQATPIQEVVESQRDPLTGTVTRPVLLDHAQHALARLEREPGWVGLLFLDLDRLKLVNDTVGHQAGDEVLLELTRRVSGLLRPGDTFARLGGDEFAVLVGDLRDPADAQRLARRIVAAGRAPFKASGVELDCSASVGLVVTSDHTQTTEALLRQADVAMYEAKTAGRGRWRVWGVRDEVRLDAQQRLEVLLAETVEAHRILLEYQPVIRLGDNRAIGAEALLRVPAPDGRVLQPAEFLDVATMRRLIGPLDVDVLHLAMSAHQQQLPASSLDLNLAVLDLEDEAWVEQATSELAAHPGARSGLRVELREELLIQLSPRAVERLATLRQAGVLVGVDSFGAGMASMATLWSYPLDYVKLDASVTGQLASVRSARAVARAVCELAHGLDLLVVAAGIETDAQRVLAQEAGCDQGQGFLWPALATVGSPAVVDLRAPNGQPTRTVATAQDPGA
jgi:diguanylate cyclase (GGDEF)-like protein